MAEVEHFCDPENKAHPKFVDVRDHEATFYSACNQMDGQPPQKLKFGTAVDSVSKNQKLPLVPLFISELNLTFLDRDWSQTQLWATTSLASTAS
jgi:glycyl-tRNA synthetase (class II)